jgi:hypothetical protein
MEEQSPSFRQPHDTLVHKFLGPFRKRGQRAWAIAIPVAEKLVVISNNPTSVSRSYYVDVQMGEPIRYLGA